LKAFCIIVLAGMESIAGGAAGAFVLAFLENAGAAFTAIPTSFQDAVSFTLLVVALVALPQGLPGAWRLLRRPAAGPRPPAPRPPRRRGVARRAAARAPRPRARRPDRSLGPRLRRRARVLVEHPGGLRRPGLDRLLGVPRHRRLHDGASRARGGRALRDAAAR